MQSHTHTYTYTYSRRYIFHVRPTHVSLSAKRNLKTKEISRYLNFDVACSKMFYGAYRSDQISNLGSGPTFIISKSKFKMSLIKKLIVQISKNNFEDIVKTTI